MGPEKCHFSWVGKVASQEHIKKIQSIIFFNTSLLEGLFDNFLDNLY
jgi:hypothetical protein